MPNKFIGAMLWGQIGRIGEFGLSFLFTVLVVRWLSQENYSTYSTIVNFHLLLLYFTNLGINDALQRYIPVLREENPLAPLWLFRRLLIIRVGSGAVLAGLMWLGKDLLAKWFNQPFISQEIGPVVTLFLAYVIFEPLVTFYLACFRVRQIVLIRFLGQLGNIIIVGLWFWLSGPMVLPILVALIISNLNMFGVGVAFLPRPGLFARLPVKLKTPLREIAGYSRDLWLITLINIGLQGQIDVILLAVLAGSSLAVPFYSLASTLISRVYNLVIAWAGSLNAIISTVLLEKGQQGLERYFSYSYRLSLPFHLIPMVGLAVISDPLVTLFFEERYHPVSWLLTLFALQNILAALLGASVIPAFINILGRQKIMLRWLAFFSLLNIGLDILLIPPLGALGAVVATSFANTLAQLMQALLVRELFARLNLLYVVKIGGAVLTAGLLAAFIGSEGLLIIIIRSGVYLGCLLLFFRLLKPVEESDKQVLLNLRPGLARILRYF